MGVGGKVGTGTVGVGTPVCGVGVGVPAKGVGVPPPAVGVGMGVEFPEVGTLVGDAEVAPAPGVDVAVGGVPVRLGVIPGETGVPSGGAVGTVPLLAAVGVGLARPFGSVGELESHAPSRAARRSPATRNGTNARTGTG